MKRRFFALAASSLLVAGCDWKANVYPMTTQQAYDKLVAAALPAKNGPFGSLDVSPSGAGNGIVRWVSSIGTRYCEANIVPKGQDKSRINVFCDGPGEGAAAGMMQGMYRSAIIEHIDATLNGRPYDPDKARGETATMWPNDPRQADATIVGAAGEAIKMDQEAREAREQEANTSAAPETSSQEVNIKPGQPMLNLNK